RCSPAWGTASGPSLRRRSERPVGDDQFLDFVRAFVEAEDPGIAVVTLHVEVAAEPVPAVDLDRPIRDALRHLRPVQLRHGNLERVVQAEVPQLGRAEGEEPRRVNLQRGLRDHFADELEIADRPSEGLALLDVLHRGLEGSPGDADRARGDADPPAVQGPHRLVPAVPTFPDQVPLRDATALEGEVRGGARAKAQFGRGLDVCDFEPGGVPRYYEQRDALVAARPRLPRVDLAQVADAPVRDD